MALLDPIRKKLVDTSTPDIDKHMRQIHESYQEAPTILGNLGDIAKSTLGLVVNTLRLPFTATRSAAVIPLTVISGTFSGARWGVDKLRVGANTVSKKIDGVMQGTRDRLSGTLSDSPRGRKAIPSA